MQVIQSASQNAAEYLGVAKDYGTLEKGKADCLGDQSFIGSGEKPLGGDADIHYVAAHRFRTSRNNSSAEGPGPPGVARLRSRRMLWYACRRRFNSAGVGAAPSRISPAIERRRERVRVRKALYNFSGTPSKCTVAILHLPGIILTLPVPDRHFSRSSATLLPCSSPSFAP